MSNIAIVEAFRALPAFIEQLALKGVVFAFDAITTQKTAQTIRRLIDSGNHYLGALKGNQSGLLKGVEWLKHRA